MKQRKNIIIFIITMILSVIVLWFFVTGYYSIDTYRIYSQGYIDYATKDAYIRDGRLFSAFIFVLVGLINPEIMVMYIINIIIAIAILSLCVIQIYHLIERYKKLEKTRSKILAFMFSYTYIFNYLIVDVLKFIDSFMIATSILLFIIAVKKIVIEKKNIVGLVLTILGVICYQGTIPVFIATAIFVTLLENKKINKEYFKRILPCAISIFIAALLSVAIVKLVPIITHMEMTDRITISNISENIEKNLMNMSRIIFNSFYMFPPYVWIGISLFIICISMIMGIKEKKIEFSINVLFIFMSFIASLLVMFPIQSLWERARIVLVLGQVISAMLIYIYCTNFENEKMNLYKKMIVSITIIYFIITIISIMKSTYDYKLGNMIDKAFSEKIENEIIRLQNEGIQIHKIGIRYAVNDKKNTEYGKLVFEQSTYLNGIYSVLLHEFYTGRCLMNVQDFTEELEQTYFENPSEEVVQFKNINDVLYILVDL